MDINITKATSNPPTPYANSLSMTIRSFKGRRDVEVHLFRRAWDKAVEAAQDWNALIEPRAADNDPSRDVIMESFTDEERDTLINYLKEQYSTRLTGIRSTPCPSRCPVACRASPRYRWGKTLVSSSSQKSPATPWISRSWASTT